MRHNHNPEFHRSLIAGRQIWAVSTEEASPMYLKKVDGPRAITLPDGTVLSRADLPPKDTWRWVASRKVVLVRAVEHGLIPLAEVLERYDLSEEEFTLWTEAVKNHGEVALKVTAIQKYRQPKVD